MTFEIFMPFYGRVDHFKQAVNSVLSQEDPDWSLTVVDDVYPDLLPGQWLKDLGDNRITYIRNTENLRPSRNYNKCAQLCSSEFIMLMGCDDVMLPRFVGRVKELLISFPNVSIIQPGVEVIDQNSHLCKPLSDRVKKLIAPRMIETTALSGEDLAVSLLRGNWTYFPSLIWRTELLRKNVFRTDLDVVQDLAMLLEITKNGGSLLLDRETIFRYRRHSMSVSAVTGPDGSKFRQERKLFNETASSFDDLGWKKAAQAAKRHWLSRANALSELPGAIYSANREGISTLSRHVLGLNYKD